MRAVSYIEAAEVSEAQLADVVQRFYAKVRQDEIIGAVFNNAIDDWAAHLQRLTAFWSSIMLASGKYKGNPMAAHTKHAAEIRPEMFERWLSLWAETTGEVFAPDIAARLQAKADNIARSLTMALEFHNGMQMPEKRK
jgi:hemoglobin